MTTRLKQLLVLVQAILFCHLLFITRYATTEFPSYIWTSKHEDEIPMLESVRGHTLQLEDLTKNPRIGSLVCPPLMTPIYDRVVQKQDNSVIDETQIKNKIPKIIHISYNNRCVPTEVFADGIQKWKDELPDYSIYFHDDDAVDRLLEQDWPEFPNLHKIMNCIKYKGAMKVDLWRMLIVYKFGGIYTDIDNIPAKEFKNGAAIHPDDTFYASFGKNNRPNQSVFAMEPQHPIAVFTVQTILKNLLDMPSLRRPKVVWTTGPVAFHEGYKNYLILTEKASFTMNPGLYTGFMNKQIRKEPKWNWLNPHCGEFVMYEGFNMTKKARAGVISGMFHWQKVVVSNQKGEDFSCREYLYLLDHNLITANWTINSADHRVL